MKPDPTRPKQGKGTVSRASTTQEALEIRDPSPAIADETLGPGLLMAEHEDPVVQVRQELGLWVSPQMKEVRDTITEAVLINLPILITGETGTGKEVVARATHYLSGRRIAAFVKMNCAGVAREFLESDLFGHEDNLRIGKLETANGGTLFLDNIGHLDPALQARLTHLLEDGQFSRVGGRSSMKVDVRIVAATSQDLEAAIATGGFREELFYRLNVLRIDVPPLRERPEEIPALANYFIRRYARLFQREAFTLPAETVQRLKQHSFPGNVRELENTIKRMVVLGRLDLMWIPPVVIRESGGGESRAKRARTPAGSLRAISREAAQTAEKSAILKALKQTDWNRLLAAKLLNISYRSLLYKIKEAGLDRKGKTRNLP
jgi:two-component system response regulator AtoC